MVKTLSMDDRVSLRDIINKKLEEARMINKDVRVLLKGLQKKCGHEQVVWADASSDIRFLTKDPQIKCLICGLMEELWETRPLVLNRQSAVKISREEFEGLGIVPLLKNV